MNEVKLQVLERLLLWANAANNRLEYEQDRETGFQFGGNPNLNPVLDEAHWALKTLRQWMEEAKEVDRAGGSPSAPPEDDRPA